MNLHPEFPGGLRKGTADYDYFLVGNIFHSADIRFAFNILQQLEQASLALGKFCAKIKELPNIGWFIQAYARKEATQSSRIEGTQTNIEEAFTQEEDTISIERRDDWLEVHCYIKALEWAIERMEQLPLSNRLIRETHRLLLDQPRGRHKAPGEFRTTQNWIGGSRPGNARFVPPSPEYISEAMSNLEQFIHSDVPMPHLIKIALIHYQFETIHPFLDGNGRIGRMLIPLYLLAHRVLDAPILYISDYFEKNRPNYYEALADATRSQQGVARWISFFLDAVCITATESMQTAENILRLKATIRDEKLPQLGRRAKNAAALLNLLFEHPVTRSAQIRKHLGISIQSTQTLLQDFVRLGILREITGSTRNRVFGFYRYLRLLEGTET